MSAEEVRRLKDRINAGEQMLRAHEQRLQRYADEVTWAVMFVGNEPEARKLIPHIFDAFEKGSNHKRWLESEITRLQEELEALSR